MIITPEQIQGWIEAGLPGASAAVTGDGTHFEAVVRYSGFAGQSMLAQHRMVFQALGDKMQGAIHALSLRTLVQ